jgi:DNA repair protein RadC
MMASKPARRIKDLPPEERPREKLLLHGPQALSDAELLAILIGSGTPQKSALALAEELLQRYQSFRGMAGRSLDEFMAIKGLKEAKVLHIAAAFEIARRVVEQVLAQQSSQI